MRRLGVPATARASFYIYNAHDDVDALIDGTRQSERVVRLSLEELYKEVILDHYRTPRNKGRLDPHDVALERNNPLCGDEIELFLKFDGDAVEGIAFEGKGCSISQASASMMTEKVKGLDAKEAARARRVDQAHDGRRGGGRPQRPRRPRLAEGRREVPGAHQVRPARLEHPAKRPWTATAPLIDRGFAT